MTGQSYSSAQIQAALLSDGRGKQPGLNLLVRVQGEDRRQKKLILSPAGTKIADRYIWGENELSLSSPNWSALPDAVLPALAHVLSVAPDINLGTFCVLLYVVEHNPKFGLDGCPSITITKELGISNLPRHLAVLSTGSKTGKDLDLIEMIANKGSDKRVVVPSLTGKGLQLIANVAAALQQKKPSPVKTPKPERLADDASQEDVNAFIDDDFDFNEIVWMGSEPDDETSAT